MRDKYLDNLLDEDYKLEEGELTITTYRLTGYNQGDYPDTEVLFGQEPGRNGLELRVGESDTSAEQALQLREWFSGLELKYNTAQPALPILFRKISSFLT